MSSSLVKAFICFYMIYASNFSFATPIPAENLFRDFEIHHAILSPDGRYLATFKSEETRTYVDLTFSDSMVQHEIITFPYTKTARLLDIEWLDNDTILIDYRHKDNSDRLQAILAIKFKDDKTPYTKAKRIWAKGYIVNNLTDKPGTVLFSEGVYDEGKTVQKLYYADYQSLMKNKVKENGIPFPVQPPSAFFVFSSYADKELLSTSFDKGSDSVDIHYFTEGMKKWEMATTIDRDNYNFNPIGIIDNKTLAVLSNTESDLRGLYKFDLKTNSLSELLYAHPKYDLISAELDPQTKKLESVTYLDHGQLASKYFSESKAALKTKLAKAFPGQQIAIIDQSEENNSSLLLVFASDNPGQYYFFNDTNSKAELVGELFPTVDKSMLSKATNINVVNKDGLELESILTRPKNESNGVLIVNPHGGPIGIRDSDNFDRKIQFLASRGYTILQVNFRGSWGFGKKFLEAGVAQFGKAIEEDISTVVDNITKRDKYKHVCAMGTSYGAYSSVMLAIKKPELYDCVIAAFGVYDLPLIFNSRNIDNIDGSIESYEKILGSMRKELWEVSPLYQAQKLQAPTLLIAGYKDKIAPMEQSNRFKMRMEQLHKPLETLFYKKSAHGHQTWYSETHHNLYLDDFIRRTLDLPPAHSDEKLLIEEYKRLADGLGVDGLVDRESKHVMRNYQQAADLGHARSQFNLAAFYHRGDEVEKDLNQAAHWYKRAAENGYNNGYYRLAQLNRRGVIDDASKEMALQYFHKAAEGENLFAPLYIARAHCFGEGVAVDIPVCFEKLGLVVNENFSEKEGNTALKNEVHGVIAELSWRLKLGDQQIQTLKNILETTKKAWSFSADIDEKDTGTFLKDSNGYYTFDDSDTDIPLKKGVVFGSTLSITRYPRNNETYGKMIALKVRWTGPIEKDNHGVQKFPYHYMHFNQYSDKFYFLRELSKDWMLKPGTWTLEVASLDGEVLFKKEFHLLSQAEAARKNEESGIGSLF